MSDSNIKWDIKDLYDAYIDAAEQGYDKVVEHEDPKCKSKRSESTEVGSN